MNERKLGISALSKLTGVKIETIRYYEREGLLSDPPRTEGGHRSYREEHIKNLVFIRRSRELGFSMKEIRELLDLVADQKYTCSEVKELTLDHARSVREKINDLVRMEETLLRVALQCSGAELPKCPIVDALSEMETEQ